MDLLDYPPELLERIFLESDLSPALRDLSHSYHQFYSHYYHKIPIRTDSQKELRELKRIFPGQKWKTIEAYQYLPVNMDDIDSLVLKAVGAEGVVVEYLSEILLFNTKLTSLDLAKNDLQTADYRQLEEALLINTTLKSLNLASTRINLDGTNILKSILINNSTLQNLNIRKSLVISVGIENIAEGLKKNRSLKYLNLNSNHIDANGIAALIEALQTAVVIDLDLSWNSRITLFPHWSDIIGEKSILTKLELESCGLTNVNAIQLAQKLEMNTALINLSLSDNNISNMGALALVEALTHNTTLKVLDLSDNNIGLKGFTALRDLSDRRGLEISLEGQDPWEEGEGDESAEEESDEEDEEEEE